MKRVISIMLCLLVFCLSTVNAFALDSPTASVVTSDTDSDNKHYCPICGTEVEWEGDHQHWHCPECGWPDNGCPNCGADLKGPGYDHCDNCGWSAGKNPFSPQTSTLGSPINYSAWIFSGVILLAVILGAVFSIRFAKKKKEV